MAKIILITILVALVSPRLLAQGSAPEKPALAPAKNPAAYNPSGYIQQKEIEDLGKGNPDASEMKEGTTTIGGVQYFVFKNGLSSILVPKVNNFNPEDLDKATCSNTTTGADGKTVSLGRIEHSLSRRASAYAEVIQKTIIAKCGDSPIDASPKALYSPKGEVGVRIKSDDPNKPTYKVYNEGLRPNVGVGAEF